MKLYQVILYLCNVLFKVPSGRLDPSTTLPHIYITHDAGIGNLPLQQENSA